jgi:coenzyme F420-reducing hydrogenase beta subunit
MLQTLMMIQDIQKRGEVKEESPVQEQVEVTPTNSSSGIATQMLHELLKNESLDSSVHIERKNTFDTEEDNITIEKTIPG